MERRKKLRNCAFLKVKSGKKFDLVGSLPVELGKLILSYLGALELASCFLVSKQWRNLANDEVIWKNLLSREGLHFEFLDPLETIDVLEKEEGSLEMECNSKRLFNRGVKDVLLLSNKIGRGTVFPLGEGKTLGMASSPSGPGLVFSHSSYEPYGILIPHTSKPLYVMSSHGVYAGLPFNFGLERWEWASTWDKLHRSLKQPESNVSERVFEKCNKENCCWTFLKFRASCRSLPSRIFNGIFKGFWFCWAYVLDKYNEPYNL